MEKGIKECTYMLHRSEMDILKTFTIGDDTTEINLQGTYENPLFQANHVGRALGIVNIHSTLKNLSNKYKVLRTAYTLGGPQETTFLTEGGLYRCIMKSKKEIAEAFQDWLAEIVTELRAHGTYTLRNELQVLQDRSRLDQQMAKLHADRMRHDLLKNSLIYAKESLVYLGKVKELEDGRTIYKFGETGDIQVRGNGLRFEHAELGELMLVDVWPCHRCKDFESFILKHHLVMPHRCHEQVRGRNARELIYISSTFTMEQLRSLIHANIGDFQGFTREQTIEVRRLDLEEKRIQLAAQKLQIEKELAAQRLHVEEKRLQLLERAIKKGYSPDILSSIVKFADDVVQDESISQTPEQTAPEIAEEVTSSDPTSRPEELEEPTFIPRQTDPCIQKYDSDFNLVAVYDTLRDAARQNENALNFEISRAITLNTLYLNHRWAHVDRERKDETQQLSATIECKRRIRDKVAKIRNGIIVELFPDARTASKEMGVGKDAVTFAINKKKGVFKDMIFKYWSRCTEEERASYEGNAEEVALVTSARQINQIEPETGAVVKTWDNMQQLVQAFKTCHKTLNKKANDGSIYKGFRWQIVC